MEGVREALSRAPLTATDRALLEQTLRAIERRQREDAMSAAWLGEEKTGAAESKAPLLPDAVSSLAGPKPPPRASVQSQLQWQRAARLLQSPADAAGIALVRERLRLAPPQSLPPIHARKGGAGSHRQPGRSLAASRPPQQQQPSSPTSDAAAFLVQRPAVFHDPADQHARPALVSGLAAGFGAAPGDIVATMLALGRERAAPLPEPVLPAPRIALATTEFAAPLPPAPASHLPVPPLPPQQQQPLRQQTRPESPSSRAYEQLLDDHSLHRFLVRRGRVVQDTPEFESFRRRCGTRWPRICIVLEALEALVARLALPLVFGRGRVVAELAERMDAAPTTQPVTMRDVLACIEGCETMPPLPPDADFDRPLPQRSERDRAALCIQTHFRRFREQRRYHALREAARRACVIQRAWRAFAARRATAEEAERQWEARLRAWREGVMAGFGARWSALCASPHAVVHVPEDEGSVEAQPDDGDVELLNAPEADPQVLGRLCDALNPRVQTLVYVATRRPSDELLGFFRKFFDVCGDAAAFQRVHFVVPESPPPGVARLPRSPARALLASYAALGRVRELLAGLPAFVVGGGGALEAEVAVHLGLPLLAPDAHAASLLRAKSGIKSLLREAGVPAPHGVHDVYSQADLASLLARLILQHMEVPRWALKCDRSVGARGLAFLDVTNLSAYASVRYERDTHRVQWGEPAAMRELETRLRLSIASELASVLQLVRPEAHARSGSRFLGALCAGGGVIEAVPARLVSSPAVLMRVAPDGSAAVEATVDQLFAAPFVTCGGVAPSSTDYSTLCELARRLAAACAKRGVAGAVTADFVVFREGDGAGVPRIWCVDVKFGPAALASSWALFRGLMATRGGAFNAEGEFVLGGEPREPRCVAMLPIVRHPGLSAVPLQAFFQLCRMRGLTFDLRRRQGACFHLFDSLAGGALGCLAVGMSTREATETLGRMLAFLSTQSGLAEGARGEAEGAGEDARAQAQGGANLVQIYSMVRDFLRIGERARRAAVARERT
jgi:hypothetical protein